MVLACAVHVSVCVCVSAVAHNIMLWAPGVRYHSITVALFISTLKLRYKQLYFGILFIFSVDFHKTEVVAPFAYHDSLQRYCF